MNFYLDNNHRKYMGLNELKDFYDLKTIQKRSQCYYIFFDDSKIVKLIHYVIHDDLIYMHEYDVDYNTSDDRSIVLPKTSRGKPRKLNWSTLSSLTGYGNYFFFYKEKNEIGRVTIGNYTNQRTYYETDIIDDISSIYDVKKWCDDFVSSSTDSDLEEVQQIKNAKIKHIKYKEGDYFRVKFGRNLYGYGRILLDITKAQENGFKYWDALMGKPLVIEMFYILTKRRDVTVKELENLKTFPAQHILNSNLYYGDYEIIGNGKLPENPRYPVMYGKSISGTNPNKIMFQCGKIYREIDYTKDKLIKKDDPNIITNFKNNSIGFNVDINEEIIKKCISENSEKSYWENSRYYRKNDLRHPKNKEYLYKVLKQFDLEYLYYIYKDK